MAGVEVLAFFDRARLQEHVDEHVEEGGWGGAACGPVDGPFVDYGEDEVAEDGLEEEHAWDEVAEDVDGAAEVAGVDVGEAEGVGHL